MVSQEAAHYISPLYLTQGHLKAVAWKERVNNFTADSKWNEPFFKGLFICYQQKSSLQKGTSL